MAPDVDAASGHVGGDQDVHFAVTELLQRLLPASRPRSPWTAPVAKPRSEQFVGQPLAARLVLQKMMVRGPRPSARRIRTDQLRLVHRMGAHVLLDGLDCGGVIAHWRGCVVASCGATGEVEDLSRHGRREQHGLTHRRTMETNFSTSGREPMSSIPSASSSTSDFTCDRSRMRRLLQVDEPSRGPDDDVDALLQGVNLRSVGLAAVDGQDPGASFLPGLGDVPATRMHSSRVGTITSACGRYRGVRSSGTPLPAFCRCRSWPARSSWPSRASGG